MENILNALILTVFLSVFMTLYKVVRDRVNGEHNPALNREDERTRKRNENKKALREWENEYRRLQGLPPLGEPLSFGQQYMWI